MTIDPHHGLKWTCSRLQARSADGTTVMDGPGEIETSPTGRLTIKIEQQSSHHDGLPQGQLSINGVTEDGRVVSAGRCFATTNNFRYPPGTTTITFLTFSCIIERQTDASTSAWTKRAFLVKNARFRGKETWTDAGFNYSAVSADIGNEKEPGGSWAMIEVEPQAVTSDDFSEHSTDLESLLRLAMRCRSTIQREDVFDEAGWKRTRLIPSTWDDKPTNLLIPWSAIGSYLQTVSPRYRAVKTSYELDIVIHYYCRTHIEDTAEVQFLFAGVTMEALKFYWASNVKNLPADRKQTGVIRSFLRPNGSAYNFKELMDMMAVDARLCLVWRPHGRRSGVQLTAAPDAGAWSPFGLPRPARG